MGELDEDEEIGFDDDFEDYADSDDAESGAEDLHSPDAKAERPSLPEDIPSSAPLSVNESLQESSSLPASADGKSPPASVPMSAESDAILKTSQALVSVDAAVPDEAE